MPLRGSGRAIVTEKPNASWEDVAGLEIQRRVSRGKTYYYVVKIR
jgi:hypothetical protein